MPKDLEELIKAVHGYADIMQWQLEEKQKRINELEEQVDYWNTKYGQYVDKWNDAQAEIAQLRLNSLK